MFLLWQAAIASNDFMDAVLFHLRASRLCTQRCSGPSGSGLTAKHYALATGEHITMPSSSLFGDSVGCIADRSAVLSITIANNPAAIHYFAN